LAAGQQEHPDSEERIVVHAPEDEDPTAALEKLAAELTARGYRTPALSAHGRPPSLTVANPAASMLTETVMAEAGWFWWPWADRIAPVSEVAVAAERVARVLRAEGSTAL
jgi:hypothetical protein